MYEWLFKDGKVNAGLECVVKSMDSWYYGSWFKAPATIVKLGGYWPYYTDGDLPDPKIDEVNEWCYIEVDGDVPDSQIRLSDLYPIKWEKEPREVLYNGKEVELVGIAENDYDEGYYIISIGDERKCVEPDDIDEIHHIWELSKSECKELAHQVCRGSIYLHDYDNTLGVPIREASDYADSYYGYMSDEYGDNYSDKDTVEEFARYLINEC